LTSLLNTESSPLLDPSGSAKNDIFSELQTVLDSTAFRTSLRAREFLSYVVHQALDGDGDSLKERSIGVHLYHRSPTYMTGEDPVVRVKAGEVRRRLAKYYAENPESVIKIELNSGSYIPQFRYRPGLPAEPSPVETPSEESQVPEPQLPPIAPRRDSRQGRLRLALICSILAVGAIAGYAFHRSHSPAQEFWGPLFAPRKTVLLCIASPISYALNSELSRRAGPSHSAADDTLLRTNTTPIVLNPETTLKAREITPLLDYFVNKDDAYVMSELSRLFARMGEDDQVRIGKDLTFAELRSAPAVLIGAYNNPWTLEISSDLPYAFEERNNLPMIQDRADPGRTWFPEAQGRLGPRDFAVVARLLSSKTGQPVVIVAGTGMVGTEAAGRLVSNEKVLNAALAGAPRGWQDRNLELVLETDQVDGASSPPRVVAMAAW
jgi:hypothetical protein